MNDKIKVVFLGTNGWYDSETGHTTCVLLDTKKCYIILDAGSGIYKIDKYITEEKPVFLFLTHFHLDHINGLHILNKFLFKKGLVICCYEGGKQYLDTIINHPYTMPLDQLPYKVKVYELKRESHTRFPYKVKWSKLLHPSYCLGYRFEFGGTAIAFCTDTGYCNTIIDLSQDADLLIAECSVKEGQESTAWPHLEPVDAAKAARNAGVKKLALIHFDAENYDTLDLRKYAEKQAAQIFVNTFSAYDEMEINI
tara:strand:+ start:291 stop:1049 length:759 start_codon:yes stop_codon:yes gene_type:complete